MSVVSSAEFLNLYPEFGDIPIDRINSMLDMVEEIYCNSKVWTESGRQKLGIMLRTAHAFEVQMQQMAQSASIAAAIGLGQSAGTPSGLQTSLEQTAYGREFQALRATLGTATGFAL